MSWVKLDDQFPFNPKVAKAGDEAAFMYVCGLCYSAAQLTDGFIAESEVPRLTHARKPMQLAVRLVDAGLWERVEGGFRVHDFHKFNPPASKVKEKREADRIRKDSARIPSGKRQDSRPVPRVPSSSPSFNETSSSSSGPLSRHRPEEEEWPMAIARQRLANRVGTPVNDQGAWLRKTAGEVYAQHRESAALFDEQHPEASLAQKCDFLEHGKRLAVVRGPCPCSNGWLWPEGQDDAEPCPDCNPRAKNGVPA